MELNKYQTPIELLTYKRAIDDKIVSIPFDKAPKEVQDEFNEIISTVPLVQWLISKDRPNIKDLPKDEKGRAIWKLEYPPIIENVDYFRKTAIHYQKTGRFTDLRPNGNPNSEYRKWVDSELDKIENGCLRPDGAWIPGYMYWFLNYCPIILTRKFEDAGDSEVGYRDVDFPEFWEGILWRYKGWDLARSLGQHFAEISKRGSSKSYTLASALSKIFVVGDRVSTNLKKKTSARGVLMAYQKEFLNKDGTLNKFEDMIDFIAQNTEFPRKRLKSSINEMDWVMGYTDLNTGAKKGTGNEILGVAIKDDPDKGRGKRASLIGLEEFGKFPNVSAVIKIAEPSVKDGDLVFGLMLAVGTGGEEGSDFSGALDLIYHPSGSHFLSFENVWDKESQVRGTSIFCFPAYVNRKGCYNKDGISDVTKALYALCFERYIAKYENPDPMQVTRTKAENPVTLQDAIMKRDGAFFPVAQITERLQEIDLNPNFFDNILVGDFAQSASGKVEFKPTNDTPIHKYNQKDNKIAGAFEIAKLPELNKDGRPYTGRYVAGLDPVDTDDANTMSFVSFFILDLWTDTIVCEWTGRLTFVDDCYEKIRLACMYYGAKLLYEAHPYSQKVITPTGIKTWKDITIGSELFAPNGNIVKVVDIPVNEEMPIYKVTLRDGREIEASDNHIWSVFTQKNRITPELKTTKEMMELGVKNKHGQSNFFIPKGNEIEFNSKEVPIDAYTMGLLLAEGCFVKHHCHKNRVQFSSSKEDLQYYKEYIPYKIIEHSYEKVNSDIEILNCKEVLKSLGLYEQKSHTKFIPDIYKYNSINIRTELLKGLMDGDGCSNKRGAKIFITTSERLCEDFKEVCRSLGINCSSKKIDYRGFSSFRVSIFTEKTIFKLPRKIQSVHTYNSKARGSKAASYIEKTAIEKIEFSHIEMGKCVTVDSKDGLYLIGDYVVTHNCNKKGLFAYFKRMNCLYLLAETPEFLKDKDFVKPGKVGNSIYGVNATNPINNYARELLKNWMLKPVTIQTDNDDAPEITIPNVMTMWNRAALDEARQWNPDGNFDRISALGMLMLIREDRIITFGDNMRKTETHVNPIANDKYFERNYKRRSHNQ